MYELGLTALTGGIVGVTMALVTIGWPHPHAPIVGGIGGMMGCVVMATLLFGCHGWTDPLPWLAGIQLTWGLYQWVTTWPRHPIAPSDRQSPQSMAPIGRNGMGGWLLGSIPFWIGSPLITSIPGGPFLMMVGTLCIMVIWSINTHPSRLPSHLPSSLFLLPARTPWRLSLTPLRQGGQHLVATLTARLSALYQRPLTRPRPSIRSLPPLFLPSRIHVPNWVTRWRISRRWRHHPAHSDAGTRVVTQLTPSDGLPPPGSPDACFQWMTRCFEGHHPFCIPGYWTHSASVAQSEWDMMARLTQWLGIEDGDRIIEMGCGGGGLTVYWGRRFPRSSIVTVTQTPTQTAHVMQRCQDAGLPNITVVQGPHTDWYDGRLADRLLLHPTQGYPAHDPATYHALRPLIRSGGTLVAHAITHPTHFYSIEDPQVAPVLGYWIPQGVIAPHPSLMVPHDGYEWSQTERWGGHHIRCSARAWQQIAQTQDRVVSHHLLPSLWVLDAIGADTTHSFGISIGRWQAI